MKMDSKHLKQSPYHEDTFSSEGTMFGIELHTAYLTDSYDWLRDSAIASLLVQTFIGSTDFLKSLF